MSEISTWRSNRQILMPEHPTKDEKSRLGYYIDWLATRQRAWYEPDLQRYRDYMLHDRIHTNKHTGAEIDARLASTTVQAHLATIRGRYQALLRDNRVRQMFYDMAPPDASPADKKAFVDEILVRIQNAVHPSTATVTVITRQDIADSEYLRLKPHQVRALLRTPGISTKKGIRDTAILAVLVCTGIREAELCNLSVSDVRESLGDELALRVRAGKGSKQRLVPYGPLDWCLLYVDKWLDIAEISEGALFRGFYKGYHKIRKTALTPRHVNRLMNEYPIMIDGELRDVKPHDLRRTYARNAYEYGMDMERIRQNLGHTGLNTTQIYIGELDAVERQPPEMFHAPHPFEELQA